MYEESLARYNYNLELNVPPLAPSALLRTARERHLHTQPSHLPEVQVVGPEDAAIGTADSASEGAVQREWYQSRPKLRPGDIVEAVPGVGATQHSGDSKANQYFLRGFNLEHGTDFAVTVDGMPVNMPAHGHGQGYADLNFLITELVSGVRYRKGPYFAQSADFSLAGSASLDYFGALEAPFVEISAGSRDFKRLLAASSRMVADQTWLGAVEIERNNGPWDVPEGPQEGECRVAVLARFA